MFQRTAAAAHSSSTRLRVVIESDDPALALSDFSAFTCAGIDVTLCSGPGADAGECPAVAGRRCDAVDHADAVFHALGLGAPGRAVLAALAECGAAARCVVSLVAGDGGPLPKGCTALVSTASPAGQVAALRQTALAHRQS
jgi:hypothetical protein